MKRSVFRVAVVQLLVVSFWISGVWAQNCVDQSKVIGTWVRYEVEGDPADILKALEAGAKSLDDIFEEGEELEGEGVAEILGDSENTLFYTEAEELPDKEALTVSIRLKGTWKIDCNHFIGYIVEPVGDVEVIIDDSAVSSEEEKKELTIFAEQVKAQISEDLKERDAQDFKPEGEQYIILALNDQFMLTTKAENEELVYLFVKQV